MRHPETLEGLMALVELRQYELEVRLWGLMDLYWMRILMEVIVLVWEPLKPKEQGFPYNDDHYGVSRA
jgi:hypothetical protein